MEGGVSGTPGGWAGAAGPCSEAGGQVSLWALHAWPGPWRRGPFHTCRPGSGEQEEGARGLGWPGVGRGCRWAQEGGEGAA